MPSLVDWSNMRAALFDVDGTLVDSVETITLGLGDTIERFAGNRPDDDEIRSIIGTPLKQQIERYRGTAATSEELQEITAFAIGRFGAYRDRESDHDDAIEAMRMMRSAGLKVALITSKNREEVDEFLPRFSGRQWIDGVVCASDVSVPKPNPESVLLACSEFNVLPSQSFLIGDSIYDMQCAKGAGAGSVAVSYGASSLSALRQENPDLIFDTPNGLLQWANNQFSTTTCVARK